MNIKILTNDMESAFFIEKIIYKLNKKYIINNPESIELYSYGFHYFENIGVVFNYLDESHFFNNKYRIFEVKPEGTIISDHYSCCSEITLIKELSFEDLINYDNTGKYTYYYAKYNEDKMIDTDKLEDIIIKKDITGKYCCLFAQNVKCANIKKLENAVIEKDTNGEWCYKFAYNVKSANIEKLEESVIKKDITGKYCCLFAMNVKYANIEKLENAVIEKDIGGYWHSIFVFEVKNTKSK
jgi:hypothetical protein